MSHPTDDYTALPPAQSPTFVWIVALITLGTVLFVLLSPALMEDTHEATPTRVPTRTPANQGVAADDADTCTACDEKCSACENLHSCAEAQQCLNDGHPELDPDGDGIPCEGLCPGG